jgi:hypothetical protein
MPASAARAASFVNRRSGRKVKGSPSQGADARTHLRSTPKSVSARPHRSPTRNVRRGRSSQVSRNSHRPNRASGSAHWSVRVTGPARGGRGRGGLPAESSAQARSNVGKGKPSSTDEVDPAAVNVHWPSALPSTTSPRSGSTHRHDRQAPTGLAVHSSWLDQREAHSRRSATDKGRSTPRVDRPPGAPPVTVYPPERWWTSRHQEGCSNSTSRNPGVTGSPDTSADSHPRISSCRRNTSFPVPQAGCPSCRNACTFRAARGR